MNRDVCEHFVPTDLHCDHCADSIALRLADELLANHGPTHLDERVAAELRRLHAEIARRDAKEADAKAFIEERKAHWAEQIALGKAKIEADRPCWEQLTELQAENEALRADAERYRWLHSHMSGAVPMVRVQVMRRGQYVLIERDLSAAIDAARSKA